MARLPHLSARLQGCGTTIFATMSARAVAQEAINLGQGFPDFAPPQDLLDAVKAAVDAGHNQYAPGNGVPALRQAVADHQRTWWGLDYDPDREITITTGATEAVFATLQALLDVGDEAILFEPYYDSYAASVAMAGGVTRAVRLRPPDWGFDPADLEAAVTDRTRVIVLNTPHNPTGAVLDAALAGRVAAVARERDLTVVTDEVYEHLTFGARHVPIATLDGMRERTVTISSAGKTFSVTGWKVGWACAPPPLTTALRAAKQWVTYTSGTPFQHAVAGALAWGSEYFQPYVAGYARRRDALCAGLRDTGLEVFEPAGTYFVTADIRPLGWDDDLAFCDMLLEEVGVAAIPCSVLYAPPRPARCFVRFAFCKTGDVLAEGIDRLQALRSPAG